MSGIILVPASGSSTDDAVFATALAAARPLAAHLRFYHVRLSETEAAVRAPHVDFCVGAALPAALRMLREAERELSQAAADHVKSFCSRHSVPLCETAGRSQTVSASYLEELGHPGERLMQRARHSDLIVLGRAAHGDYLPPLLMEDILLGSGRPMLLAPDFMPATVTRHIVVGWKETPEAARALGAAMPLLEAAGQVTLLHALERQEHDAEFLGQLADQLKWHGINADSRVIAAGPRTATLELSTAAASLGADLLVVGGFGQGRFREWVFGGVTRSVLEQAALPVLMMH